MSSSVFSLSPDGYSRFYVLLESLKKIYGQKKRTIKVLDVGGCSPFFGEIIRGSGLDIDLTIVDILPKPDDIDSRYIQADITKWDGDESGYDAVISTDVLEHIPQDQKDDFVNACIRLAKDVCIIAAPFNTPGVVFAEEKVNDFNKRLFGKDQDWLKEHFECGNPSIDLMKSAAEKLRLSYEHFGTNNIYSWVFSAHVNLLEAKLGLDGVAIKRLNSDYNKNIASSSEFDSDTYRHFFFFYKGIDPVGIEPMFSGKADPDNFVGYMHEMFDLVAQRISELRDESSTISDKLMKSQELIESQKAKIDAQAYDLKDFSPFLRRIAKLQKRAKSFSKNKGA